MISGIMEKRNHAGGSQDKRTRSSISKEYHTRRSYRIGKITFDIVINIQFGKFDYVNAEVHI